MFSLIFTLYTQGYANVSSVKNMLGLISLLIQMDFSLAFWSTIYCSPCFFYFFFASSVFIYHWFLLTKFPISNFWSYTWKAGKKNMVALIAIQLDKSGREVKLKWWVPAHLWVKEKLKMDHEELGWTGWGPFLGKIPRVVFIILCFTVVVGWVQKLGCEPNWVKNYCGQIRNIVLNVEDLKMCDISFFTTCKWSSSEGLLFF